jgi:membrane associated rhomboid family serine protease
MPESALIQLSVAPVSESDELDSSAGGWRWWAYVVMFPRSRVQVLIFSGFFVQFTRVTALLFVGVWFITQLFNGAVRRCGLLGSRWRVLVGPASGVLAARASARVGASSAAEAA